MLTYPDTLVTSSAYIEIAFSDCGAQIWDGWTALKTGCWATGTNTPSNAYSFCVNTSSMGYDNQMITNQSSGGVLKRLEFRGYAGRMYLYAYGGTSFNDAAFLGKNVGGSISCFK